MKPLLEYLNREDIKLQSTPNVFIYNDTHQGTRTLVLRCDYVLDNEDILDKTRTRDYFTQDYINKLLPSIKSLIDDIKRPDTTYNTYLAMIYYTKTKNLSLTLLTEREINKMLSSYNIEVFRAEKLENILRQFEGVKVV